jgi:hypothetical protein
MRGCIVDVENQTILVEGGCILGDIDRELESTGLAVPTGTYHGTGVGGLALSGGIGHLMRKVNHSMADAVLEMKVVLADGSVVKCNDRINQDLFWAMKGSGGNFGIVTSFVFKCFPVQDSVYGGFRMEGNVDLIDRINALAKISQDSDDMSFVLFLLNPPDGPEPGLIGQHILHFGTDPAKVAEDIAMSTKGPVVADFGEFEHHSFHSANIDSRKLLDTPPPSHQYWKLFMTKAADWTPEHAAICDKAFQYVRENPVIANGSLLIFECWCRDAKAHSLNSSWNLDGLVFVFEVVVGWFGDENKKEGMEHVEAMTSMIKDGGLWKSAPEMGFGYSNYNMSYDDHSEELYVTNQDRLLAAKAKWDPTNTFRKGKFAQVLPNDEAGV